MDLAAVAERLRRITVGLANADHAGGAGVVWTPGLIVTAAHVVRGPRLAVRLADGRRSHAVVVAREPSTDLALLRAPEVDLPPAIVAEPGPMRVGALIIAVGHPLGLRGAVTTGVVHALGPIVPGGRPWIQADLRLAPGNSGGPLADARGYLVGLNAMIAGGLALAIPVSEVRRFVTTAGAQPA